jgi:hypothetical protein
MASSQPPPSAEALDRRDHRHRQRLDGRREHPWPIAAKRSACSAVKFAIRRCRRPPTKARGPRAGEHDGPQARPPPALASSAIELVHQLAR